MPVVFIHGVNVRDRYQNLNDALAMGELLVDRVLRPLADEGVAPLASLRIDPLLMRVPYWGDDGVKFRWSGATLPNLRATDILGGAQNPNLPSETQIAALADLLNQSAATGPTDQPLLRAARSNFPLFIDIVLMPMLESEVCLIDDPALREQADEGPTRSTVGPALEALLVTAAEQLATDTEFKRRIDSEIRSDEQLVDEVESQLIGRFRALVQQHEAAGAGGARAAAGVDVMGGGGLAAGLKDATDRVKEFFVRVAHSPSRITSVVGLKALRGALNSTFTRFTGDIFEYLYRRGDRDSPGKIVSVVLAELDAATARRPGEPLIVITHSMGGNIFYDILTHYRPSLTVDLWISVGGQVGLFEEMKLFHASDPDMQAPQKVDQLGARVKCWLNVYDPADPAAFLAGPVFQNVKDVRFSTGAGDYRSHLNYFKRSRFFRSLYDELQEASKQ